MDKGKDVEYVQDRLAKYGYNIEVDGAFGYATYEAILNFQYKTNLKLNGEANKKTIDELKKSPTKETMYTPKTPIDFTYIHSDITRFVNENNIVSYTDYLLVTSRQNRMTYIFKKNNGKYDLLDSFICTVGASSTPTITGDFRVGIRGLSFGQEKGFQAKYYTQISGNYLYHSILYNKAGTRVTDGRLGGAYSHGCIRLDTDKAKWIYDNIPQHTTVIIQ
jgi:lipoprotein-anchoring transpeptidase ErfK/SrfK